MVPYMVHHPAVLHSCRLLQGDVGSGKTIVAMLAMLAAAGSGVGAGVYVCVHACVCLRIHVRVSGHVHVWVRGMPLS